MLLENIEFIDNKYITTINNTITKEIDLNEFDKLKDACDYTLKFKEDYYNFKFNKNIFELNFEIYKLTMENMINPTEELESEIKLLNYYYRRMLIQSRFYTIANLKDNSNDSDEVLNEEVTVEYILNNMVNIFDF